MGEYQKSGSHLRMPRSRTRFYRDRVGRGRRLIYSRREKYGALLQRHRIRRRLGIHFPDSGLSVFASYRSWSHHCIGIRSVVYMDGIHLRHDLQRRIHGTKHLLQSQYG